MNRRLDPKRSNRRPTRRGEVGRPARPGRGTITALTAVAFALGGCAPGPTPAPVPGSRSPVVGAVSGAAAPVPAGLGTLHQDEFTIELRSDAVLVKATPLAEAVIRLAAPDTYERLHALATRASERARATAGASAELWLVSVYSYSTGAAFQPEDLRVLQQGRTYRAAGVLPLTAGWGRQGLEQRQVESAVYVYRGPLDYDTPLSIQYAGEVADDWTHIIPLLQAERARVRSRSASAGHASMPYSLILR